MNNRDSKQTRAERREQKNKKKMKVSGSGVKQLKRIIAKKQEKA